MPYASDRRVNSYLRTITAIISSRDVSHYVIGMTGQRLWNRSAGYRKRGSDHCVVLANRMTGDEALHLENQLQFGCIHAAPRGLLQRKYHPDHAMMLTHPGGGTRSLFEGDYSVYLAWWCRS
jgi:hypothetical protein